VEETQFCVKYILPIELGLFTRDEMVWAFEAAEMVCIRENLFEDGEWAIPEWRDPTGLRGCGFFHIVDGQMAFQRGDWDKLLFLRLHGLSQGDNSN